MHISGSREGGSVAWKKPRRGCELNSDRAPGTESDRRSARGREASNPRPACIVPSRENRPFSVSFVTSPRAECESKGTAARGPARRRRDILPPDSGRSHQSHYEFPNVRFFQFTSMMAPGMHTCTPQAHHVKAHICQHNFSPQL